MFVYRISKEEYIHDLSGIGSGLYGGRWNPKGIRILYTSGTIALAYVEFLVHNYHLLRQTNVCMAKIHIPEPMDFKIIEMNNLSPRWHTKPHDMRETQDMGKQFADEGKFHVLKVPSAIIPGEFNYLLNPEHIRHNKIQIKEIIQPLQYDPRLLNLS